MFPSSQVLTSLSTHLFIRWQSSSITLHNLYNTHQKKNPANSTFSKPAPERLTNWRLNLQDHRQAHLKFIINNLREPRILPHFVLSLVWITPSHFLLPLSRSQMIILLISLRKLKQSEENMHPLSPNLPTCMYPCQCPVFSTFIDELSMLHLSPSIPTCSEMWFLKLPTLFPVPKFFFLQNHSQENTRLYFSHIKTNKNTLSTLYLPISPLHFKINLLNPFRTQSSIHCNDLHCC